MLWEPEGQEALRSGAANPTDGKLSLASRIGGLVVRSVVSPAGRIFQGKKGNELPVIESLICARTLPAMCWTYSRYSVNKVLND